VDVEEGEIVALLGPNGAGKTTLLLSVAGLLPRLGGSVSLDGRPLPTSAAAVNRHGAVLVPDDRSLFGSLTVAENLRLADRAGTGTAAVVALFPELAPRLHVAAALLSGGEQQMLAIARALVQKPRVLLVDELSMGLAPMLVTRILDALHTVAMTGVAIVVVEQHVRAALEHADRAIVLVRGEIQLEAPARALRAEPGLLHEAYLS
jgi:branched-chain amino acid transport system ATP-binding protein